MTEQEAEEVAARLTRIWAPEHVSSEGVTWTRYEKVEATTFWTLIEGEVQLFCDDEYADDGVQRRRIFRLMHCRGATGYLEFYDGKIGMSDAIRSPAQKVLCEQFANEWLPFFRRGCWLSGCAIKATADEKMEWMRSVSYEEVKPWGLKM